MATARTLNPRGWLLGGARGKEALWIAWQRASPGIVSFTVVVVDGIAGGGYFPRAWRLTSFALLALALAALVGRRRIALGLLERWFLGLVAALTAWTAASTIWSDTPATSVLEAERDVVYLAAVVAVLLALERESLPVLLGGVLGGITAVAGYGLGTYVLYDHPLNPIEGKLLFEPLGYANGLGIYAAIGILLAVGLALALRPPLLRLTCLAPAAIAVVVAASLRQEHTLVTGLFGANRPHYWHVAWREVTLNPVLGSGAGTFERYWLLYRPVGSFARDAHSLYLETLAELGPIGLVLLLAALGLPLLVLRGRRDPVLATAAAGYVAYLIHTGVDWDWELPAVTLCGFICGSGLLLWARRPDAPELRPWERLALIVPAVCLAVLVLVRLETGPKLPFAT